MLDHTDNNILITVKSFVESHNLIKPHDTIILGLSGGPDSVFLLYFLKNLQQEFNLTIIAAHLDHEWRTKSHLDNIFCKNLADSLDITYISTKASDIKLIKKTSGSKEELGRLLRRQFFQDLANKYNAQSIALAHHADDQQETFFIRLLRGASISGLAGIRPKHGLYIHPLLNIKKQEIINYLNNNNIKYLEDYTNNLDIYLRNKIRNYTIPALRYCDSRFDINFAKTLDNIQQTEDFLVRITNSTFKEITQEQDNIIILDINKFLSCDKFLYTRLILLWLCKAQVYFVPSTALFKEILKFLKQKDSGKHLMYNKWHIIKRKNLAFIEKLS